MTRIFEPDHFAVCRTPSTSCRGGKSGGALRGRFGRNGIMCPVAANLSIMTTSRLNMSIRSDFIDTSQQEELEILR